MLPVPHQPLPGKARGSTSHFLKLSRQENKQTKNQPGKTPQSQHRAMARPARGVPGKTFHVGPRAPGTATAPAMKVKLLFIAKWPFREKFGGVSRALGFGSSLEGAETSSEAGSNVSQCTGLGKGIFWDLGRVNGAICGTRICPGIPGASRGKGDFWEHQQQ